MNSNGHSLGEIRKIDRTDFAALLKRLRAEIQRQSGAGLESNGRAATGDDVEWQAIVDLLDRLVPDWSHAVRGIVQIGEIVVATVALTIQGVTREGVGTGSAESEAGIRRAERDGLKRAAARFGISRDLDRVEDDGYGEGATFDPLAKTKGDLISPKQLSLIRSLAKRARLDPDVLCQETYKAGLLEISRRAASGLIDYLESHVPAMPSQRSAT